MQLLYCVKVKLLESLVLVHFTVILFELVSAASALRSAKLLIPSLVETCEVKVQLSVGNYCGVVIQEVVIIVGVGVTHYRAHYANIDMLYSSYYIC